MEVEVIEVDTSGFEYENLEEWFVNLSEFEKKSWSTLLSKTDFDLDECDQIFNTAIKYSILQ